MSVDFKTQSHPAAQRAAVAHAMGSVLQAKHWVDTIINLEFRPLHCKQRERCVPRVVLCNVTMYFFPQ